MINKYDNIEYRFGNFIINSPISFNGDIQNFIQNISIISLKFWGLRNVSNNQLNELQNMIKAYHGLESNICDIFIPKENKNCIFEVVKFILINKFRLSINNDYDFFIYMNNILGIKRNQKLFNLISLGQIVKAFKLINNYFNTGCIIYVYSSNTIIFKELFLENKVNYHLILYRSKIGLSSLDKFLFLTKYRLNNKRWWILPNKFNFAYNNENIPQLKETFVLRSKIKKNKTKNSKMKKNLNIWSWDIETLILNYNEQNKIHKYTAYCICIYREDNYKKYFWGKDCIIEFISFLVELYNENNDNYHLFYSFNGARFDNVFLYPHLLISFYNNIKLIGKPSNIKELIIGDKIYFYDLRLLLTQGSLNTLSKDLLHQQKEDYNIMEVVKSEDKFNLEKNNIIKYCFQDCKLVVDLVILLKKFVYQLIKEENKENLLTNFTWNQPTLALLSLNIWKEIFPNDFIIYGSSKINIYQYEKDSYKGGMCLPIKKYNHNQKVYHYDINSSYPTVMRDCDMPISFKNHVIRTHTNKIFPPDNVIPHYLYRVHYKLYNNVIIPPFPQRVSYKNKINGLIYVLSNFDKEYGDWIWGVEILKHQLHIETLLCYEYIEYNKGNIFTKYIETLYAKRKEIKTSNPSYAFFLKLLMNSLYGKFGQQKFGKQEVIPLSQLNEYFLTTGNTFHDDQKDFYESIKDMKDIFQLNEEHFIHLKYHEDNNLNFIGSCVRIASFITAVARCALFTGIYNVGSENILYFDTDSIFSLKPIKEDFTIQIGKELGNWSLEEDNIKEAIFLCPKVYAYKTNDNKEILKCKGIPKRLLTFDMFLELDKKGLFSMLNINEIHIKDMKVFWQENLTKILKIVDIKRKYDSEGNSIPFNNLTELISFIK
jgi:hypothetical protein